MRKKRALITGITGQDGSYLAEFLLEKGYELHGIEYAGSSREHVAHIEARLQLREGDVTDEKFIHGVIAELQPEELYNLASVSTVARPWENPQEILQSTGFAPFYMLESIRTKSPHTRFFQASSAEMYGDIAESPQTENTPFRPRNIYGIGKLLAHNLVEAYRRDQGVYAVSGILFNHESSRRRPEFVTRKITATLARIAHGSDETLSLGNLEAQRDWSYAGDVVEAMWMTLQAGKADSFVIASGEVHTVREFVEEAARALGIELVWEGTGEEEVGKDHTSGRVIVNINPKFYRPVESHVRQGDLSKISKELGWRPKTSFQELIKLMVETEK